MKVSFKIEADHKGSKYEGGTNFFDWDLNYPLPEIGDHIEYNFMNMQSVFARGKSMNIDAGHVESFLIICSPYALQRKIYTTEGIILEVTNAYK